MKKIASLLVPLACLASLVVAGTSPLSAQDPVDVNAAKVTIKVDNDQVRVLDVVLQPGDKENLHFHPASVLYVVSGGKLLVHDEEGSVVDKTLTAGDVAYRGRSPSGPRTSARRRCTSSWSSSSPRASRRRPGSPEAKPFAGSRPDARRRGRWSR